MNFLVKIVIFLIYEVIEQFIEFFVLAPVEVGTVVNFAEIHFLRFLILLNIMIFFILHFLFLANIAIINIFLLPINLVIIILIQFSDFSLNKYPFVILILLKLSFHPLLRLIFMPFFEFTVFPVSIHYLAMFVTSFPPSSNFSIFKFSFIILNT